MRTAPQVVKNNIIHDEDILSARWSLCSGCEFLTESNRCTKCGCFMKVKHKLASARCPIGKWERHEEATGVITVYNKEPYTGQGYIFNSLCKTWRYLYIY